MAWCIWHKAKSLILLFVFQPAKNLNFTFVTNSSSQKSIYAAIWKENKHSCDKEPNRAQEAVDVYNRLASDLSVAELLLGMKSERNDNWFWSYGSGTVDVWVQNKCERDRSDCHGALVKSYSNRYPGD
ncbi:hypothetical protein L596_023749 [Steinernema carpocapsae]|uniref:C-type lectin domain-containing protein n=1 Tax=Steinernema carpocapsae TaxID=34508 RepID=A0A4U5MEK5_STECR|nr:hypothetical protein L596_023749 [Steinernema carpocapsae]